MENEGNAGPKHDHDLDMLTISVSGENPYKTKQNQAKREILARTVLCLRWGGATYIHTSSWPATDFFLHTYIQPAGVPPPTSDQNRIMAWPLRWC